MKALLLVLAVMPTILAQGCYDIAFDCDCKLGLCRNFPYVNQMHKMCRKSCGWCDKTVDEVRNTFIQGIPNQPNPAPEPGVPEPAPGPAPAPGPEQPLPGDNADCVDSVNVCGSLVSKCNVPEYNSFMEQNCAKTCGMCTPQVIIPPPAPVPPRALPAPATTCTDTSPDCSSYRSMCSSLAYKKFMQQRCARTCGFCSNQTNTMDTRRSPGNPPRAAKPVSGLPVANRNCLDTAYDCTYKRAMCNVAAYKSLMERRCPKTCGMC